MPTFEQLSNTSKVWVYQSNREFSVEEARKIDQQIVEFAQQWQSHGAQLSASGSLLFNRFIVLMNDETIAGASGCSIDTSVRFIKNIEQEYGVEMFDRMLFSYKIGEEVKSAHRDEFSKLYQDGVINDETIVFDNLVANKADFEAKWLLPLKNSWHKRMV